MNAALRRKFFIMELTHIYSPKHLPTAEEKTIIQDFLFTHLEAYGDPLADITKAVDYALGAHHAPGGLVLISRTETGVLTGAAVINKTGMKNYIPENICVYIATHPEFRGQGIGRNLMQLAIQHTEGDMALHVEPNNPAKYLYESLGFTNKYLEMRFKKN